MPSARPQAGVATRNASSTLARNIVASAHQRSGTPQPLVVQLVQGGLGHGAHPGTRRARVAGARIGCGPWRRATDGTVEILITRTRRRTCRCRRTPIPATPAPTSSPPSTCASSRASGRWCRPASRSRCPTGTSAWCTLAPGWPPSSASSIVNAPGHRRRRLPRARSACCWSTSTRATPVDLSRGDRIAQLVVQQVEQARFVEVERLARLGTRRRWVRFHRRFLGESGTPAPRRSR